MLIAWRKQTPRHFLTSTSGWHRSSMCVRIIQNKTKKHEILASHDNHVDNKWNVITLICYRDTNCEWYCFRDSPLTITWWRHQIETFSALLTICVGNSPVTGELPAQRPVTRSFGVFFDMRPNKRLSKYSWGWWFKTSSRPLWRHNNEITKCGHRLLAMTINECGSLKILWTPSVKIHSESIAHE